MDVKEISIDAIEPYQKNAKKHPKKQIEQIAKSIDKFGWAQPLAIDDHGTIVIGHGRYEAAKMMGLETVPCVTIDDLTDDEIRMLRLADNKLNESDWDMDVLAEELDDLDFSDFDLDWGLDDEQETDDKYTDIVNVPQYTPNDDGLTEISELTDETKMQELLDEIETADINEDEKDFLRTAAMRHVKFNYSKIADYYAGATPEMQKLMEDSALVVIDLNDAIRNGYATFKSKIGECI